MTALGPCLRLVLGLLGLSAHCLATDSPPIPSFPPFITIPPPLPIEASWCLPGCSLVAVTNSGSEENPKWERSCAIAEFLPGTSNGGAGLQLEPNRTTHYLFTRNTTLYSELVFLVPPELSAQMEVHLSPCEADPKTPVSITCEHSTGIVIYSTLLASRRGPRLVTISNLLFSGCHPKAVTVGSDEFLLRRTTFMNNTASGNGTSMSVVRLLPYGGALASNAKVYITESAFINNTAASGGAAVSFLDDIHIQNSVFKGNTALSGRGGALYAFGTVHVHNCTFSDNLAESGGALFSNKVLHVSNSSFFNNSATQPPDTVEVVMERPVNYGGCMVAAGNITAVGVLWVNNSARYQGAAVYGASNIHAVNCTAIGQWTGGNGGVIKGGANIWLEGGLYKNNSAGGRGGVLTTFQRTALTTSLFVSGTVFESNSARDGGALWVGYVEVEDAVFTNNSAETSGGAIYARLDATLRNVRFDSNQAKGILPRQGGGGVYTEKAIYAENITGFRNVGQAGGVLNSYSNLTLVGGLFEENIAASIDLASIKVGGALFCKNDLTMKGIVARRNRAQASGHVAYAEGSMTVSNLLAENNGYNPANAKKAGAATIYSKYSLTLQHSIFRRCVSNDTHSSVFAQILTAKNCTFENTISDSGTVSITNGTIYKSTFRGNRYQTLGSLSCAECTVDTCLFDSNSAATRDPNQPTSGSAVFAATTLTAVNTVFRNNSGSKAGGAVYVALPNPATITNCSFVANHAGGDGGGIYSHGMLNGVDTCTFTDNTCGGDGANYYAQNGSQVDPPISKPGGPNPLVVGLAVGFSVVMLVLAAVFAGTVYRLRRGTASVDYDALVARIRAQHQWTDAGSSEAAALIGRLQGQAGPVARGHFTLLETLGAGQFGTVSRGVVFVQGRAVVCAVKTAMQTDPKARADFLHEAELMKRVRHKNVVAIIGVCDPQEEASALQAAPGKATKKPNKAHKSLVRRATRPGSTGGGGVDSALYLLMEYMDRGDLKNYLIKNPLLPAPQRLWLAKEIATALEYLASLGIVHRDVAARNVLLGTLAGGRLCAKLSDLGLARVVGGEQQQYVKTAGGDLLPVRWMAPEAIFDSTYTEASDVWAFGVTVWEIESKGDTPYSFLTTSTELIQAIHHGSRLQRPESCPEEVFAVIESCWAQEPSQRPTFTKLREKFEELHAKYETPQLGVREGRRLSKQDTAMSVDAEGYVDVFGGREEGSGSNGQGGCSIEMGQMNVVATEEGYDEVQRGEMDISSSGGGGN